MHRRHRLAACLTIAAAAVGAAPSAALAAGPVPPSRHTETFECGALGSITIVTPPSSAGDSWSAAQVVGDGHLIPVAFRYLAVDTTAGIVLGDETVSHGTAHRQQATTTCTSSTQARLCDLMPPDAPLPGGTQPSDLVTLSFIVTAVVKA
jgi:hypothetical protein